MARVDQVELDRELISSGYALWNVGDMATLAEQYWAEDVEWHDPPGGEGPGIYTGREAVIARILELGVRLGLPKIAGVEVTEVNGQYVAELELVFKMGAATSADMGNEAIPYVHVVRVADGRVTRIMAFSDAAAAFAAAAEGPS
jgi:ketosteroid isomerase-like protein